LDNVLDLLGAEPLLSDVDRLTLGTLERSFAVLGTEVAAELAVRAMEGHGDTAMLAASDIAAVRAKNTSGKTTTVEEENTLLLLLKTID
jgi:hypothetical protein